MKVLNDFSVSVHKALSEIDPNYMDYEGLVICGTHNFHDTEMMIEEIRKAREIYLPCLFICAGHQLAWIEYCRNVLGLKDATSEEFGKGNFVVKKRVNPLVGQHDNETYWSYYQCVDLGVGHWNSNNVISVPFHPEYQSSKENPHPLLVKFLKLCKTGKSE